MPSQKFTSRSGGAAHVMRCWFEKLSLEDWFRRDVPGLDIFPQCLAGHVVVRQTAGMKFHARGPVGVEQLTRYKYAVRGSGQIRR